MFFPSFLACHTWCRESLVTLVEWNRHVFKKFVMSGTFEERITTMWWEGARGNQVELCTVATQLQLYTLISYIFHLIGEPNRKSMPRMCNSPYCVNWIGFRKKVLWPTSTSWDSLEPPQESQGPETVQTARLSGHKHCSKTCMVVMAMPTRMWIDGLKHMQQELVAESITEWLETSHSEPE